MTHKIFIHIPKNGGFSIHKCTRVEGFNNPEPNHLDAKYLRNLRQYSRGKPHSVGVGHCRWRDLDVTHRKNAGQSVAVIRNPWSKLVSQYLFKYRLIVRRKNYSLSEIFNILPESFEEFLELRHGILTETQYNWHRTTVSFSLQKDYVTDVKGALKCDILRFEHYDEDTMKYFNLDKPIGVGNVSNGQVDNEGKIINRIDYRDFYNDTTKQIVSDWFKEDIDFFGFTFEGSATKNIWNK